MFENVFVQKNNWVLNRYFGLRFINEEGDVKIKKQMFSQFEITAKFLNTRKNCFQCT